MERRKPEARAVWEKRIERLRSSDLTFAEFAAEAGVNLHTLKQWKYRFDRESQGKSWPPPRRNAKERRSKDAAAETRASIPQPRFTEFTLPQPVDIRMDVAGATLHLPANFDEDALRRALRILREAA